MGRFDAHLITENLPTSLNAQYEMEALSHQRSPLKVTALSRWKAIDIQRVNPDGLDYGLVSSCLGQDQPGVDCLDPFSSDLPPGANEKKSTRYILLSMRCSAAQLGALLLKRRRCLHISAFCREAIAERLECLERLEVFK